MPKDLIPAEEAGKILAEKEANNQENFPDKSSNKLPTVEELHEKALKNRVDKDNKLKPQETSEIHGTADNMWKGIVVDQMPTKGLFYPDDIQITIRPAMVEEIRHWSTMDEFDPVSINEKINMIVEKCVRMQDNQRLTHDWREIKEVDRLWLVIRVYELSFPNKENVLYLKFGCNLQCKGDGDYKEDVPLTSDMLNMFEVPEEVMQYYDPARKCFIAHSDKLNKDIKFYMPSIGVSQHIKNIIQEGRTNNKHVDISFAKIAPYLFNKFADIKEAGAYEEKRAESYRWEKNELLFINGIADKLEAAINLNIKKECPKCGVILEMPLFFRGGFTIKNFFAVSTGFNDLI